MIINSHKYAVLSFSGGMDSSSLLLHLLAEGYIVTAVSFDYGQKHKVELKKALSLINFLKRKNHKVDHHIVKIDGISQLLNSSLVQGGNKVPGGCYNKNNMYSTVVPNRNKIFSSIIQAAALSIANAKNTDTVIAMGVHSGDHIIYPDCRQLFRDKDYEAFLAGNWDADKVTYYLPYIHIDKADVLANGIKSCKNLNLNYIEVYRMTFTSYLPIEYDGNIYSDYKSASSIERIEAFLNLGLEDPIVYANEKGEIVSWKTVKEYVLKKMKRNLNE